MPRADFCGPQQIARYRGRRTPAEELLRVDDHISQCAECRERLASRNELLVALKGLDTRPLLGQQRKVRPAPLEAASRGTYLQDMSPTSPPGAPQAEHLTYEELEAYVDGKRFRVLDQRKADELTQFKATHPEAHLALGILYARAGLLQLGENELKQISESQPEYRLAQNLLKSIQQIRNPQG